MNLHDAIDQNKFIIDDKTLTDNEIQAMDIDALETLKMRINKKINGISASIKEKQIDYAEGGERAPKEWYMSRRHALSINQRVLTYVNSLIKKRRGAEKSLADCFVDKARIFLSTGDFETILNMAQAATREDKGA
jgi:hypothetical protein